MLLIANDGGKKLDVVAPFVNVWPPDLRHAGRLSLKELFGHLDDPVMHPRYLSKVGHGWLATGLISPPTAGRTVSPQFHYLFYPGKLRSIELGELFDLQNDFSHQVGVFVLFLTTSEKHLVPVLAVNRIESWTSDDQVLHHRNVGGIPEDLKLELSGEEI